MSALPSRNLLLACLPEEDYQRLSPHLEVVSMELGQAVYEAGAAMKHVHFPIDCIISLLYVMENGDSAEIAMVGSEGMAGISLALGSEIATGRAVVQSDGRAFRLDGTLLQQEFARAGALQNLLLRYTEALFSQITQTAACNKHHSVPQQLCRWLLLSLDRLSGDRLMTTQGLIANMLGVRREGVTDAAGILQVAGLILYEGGTITVLDRPGLELAACECYSAVKRDFDRLMPDVKAG